MQIEEHLVRDNWGVRASIQCHFPSWALFRCIFVCFVGPFLELEYLGFWGVEKYYLFKNPFGALLGAFLRSLFNDTELTTRTVAVLDTEWERDTKRPKQCVCGWAVAWNQLAPLARLPLPCNKLFPTCIMQHAVQCRRHPSSFPLSWSQNKHALQSVISSTEMRFNICTWFGEISSCSCLTVLPGPAWVLLSKICKD